ncbi:type I-E CRISPR-associated protein Cse2/CasB [Streptomyces platensis]|uniref:type I-E CRISPR-associated protein Cse2/CasB n=1 Tax=Streptomyces platensis TaxID=58346 RepID=UPI0036BD0B48
MLTTAQRRAHYDDFVAQVIDLCTTNGIRADLADGRGRPVEQCSRMQEHLTRHIAGYGARRAHYTIASLIAIHRHLGKDGPYTPETVLNRDTWGKHSVTTPSRLETKTPAPGVACANGPGDAREAAQAWRKRPNLGATLAIAVARHGFKEARMNDRVKTLTRLTTPLLHPRLWSLTTHLRSKNAARLDFAVLLEDLAWWDHDTPEIATRWRESYFLTLDALDQPKEH